MAKTKRKQVEPAAGILTASERAELVADLKRRAKKDPIASGVLLGLDRFIQDRRTRLAGVPEIMC